MPATTRSGRTRNRRVQSLSSTISGQPPMIYAYGVTIVGVTLTFSIYDSSFNLVSSPAIPPGAKLRVITSPDGVVFTEQALPISEAAGIVTITPAVPPVSGDLLIILPWNEGLRGSRGEWVSAAILDVP